ncbi:MAG: aminodeoxychorismate lyase, partial [Pricia sp.]
MYIKKILFAILLAGLVAGGIFAYMVYDTIFAPNTSFNNEQAFVFIPSDANFSEVVQQLDPLLEDTEAFQKVAER